MSGEIIAIVTVGVALAGLILTSNRGLRQDLARVESRLDARISALESRVDTQIGELREYMDAQIGELREHMDAQIGELRERMDAQIGELRERMAHLEGLLEGLREAIAGRVAS